MELVKEKLKQEIDHVQDEAFLAWMLSILQAHESEREAIVLSEGQLEVARRAKDDYQNGIFVTTEELLATFEDEA